MAAAAESASDALISPSEIYPELTRVIPRLDHGKLLARHVATITAADFVACGWCGKPFVEGDEWMVDLYQQNGQSDTSISIGGRAHSFAKTEIVMVHTKKECLGKSCTMELHKITQLITAAQRKEGALSFDQLHMLVLQHFKWAVRWISWHKQYALETTMCLSLASVRPQLTSGLCDAFTFVISNLQDPENVKAPRSLLTRAFVEACFTHVYEFDLSYSGKMQPLASLQDALDASPFSKADGAANVLMLGHLVMQTSYDSQSSNVQHLKVICKIQLPEPVVNSVLRALGLSGAGDSDADSRSWISFFKFLAACEAGRSGGLSTDINSLFGEVQENLDRVFREAGVKLSDHVEPSIAAAEVDLQEDHNDGKITLRVRSNCYSPSKERKSYYFFNCSGRENEQPVFCYAGVLAGPVPILIADQALLGQEMAEAGMKKVNVASLKTLRVTGN